MPANNIAQSWLQSLWYAGTGAMCCILWCPQKCLFHFKQFCAVNNLDDAMVEKLLYVAAGLPSQLTNILVPLEVRGAKIGRGRRSKDSAPVPAQRQGVAARPHRRDRAQAGVAGRHAGAAQHIPLLQQLTSSHVRRRGELQRRGERGGGQLAAGAGTTSVRVFPAPPPAAAAAGGGQHVVRAHGV